jgi:toluene monooxygenase system ferredoxin subunit
MTQGAARQPICKTADVPVNGIRQFGDICIVNAGDRFFACQASCPHEGVALCEGVFDGEILTCLEHLWQWSLREAGDPRGLAEKALEMHEVEVEGDAVFLKKP